jgi:hypothetical protein
MRDDGAEYRLHNRHGPFAHGLARPRARPFGVLSGTWATLRFLRLKLFARRRALKTLA